jgi:hypothetical protein
VSEIKIHFHPVLCDAYAPDITGPICTSRDIEKVTCPKCVYYYFRPEARELERAYKAGRL